MTFEPVGQLPPPVVASQPTWTDRATALFEVIICSGLPTQLGLASLLLLAGFPATGPDGTLDAFYVVSLSLVDTVAVVALALVFLRAHGERPGAVFLGDRPSRPEALLGIPLIGLALLLAGVLLVTIQQFAPWLRTVPVNPLQELLDTPLNIAVFGVVVVVAGGVREEIQRAFILHRFERWLGGGTVGVAVTSVAFGLGHWLQGVDAAIATAALGALWAVVYLRRRSVIAPIVSHSGFNLLQLVQFLLIARQT